MKGAELTRSRKADHVRICLEEDVQTGGTGLDRIRFVHRALPEMNMAEVKTGVRVLGRDLKLPLIINAMTGGYPEARKLNRELAGAAARHGVGLGLGSMRAMIEDPALSDTYQVRDLAPDILLLGNIGIPQLLMDEHGPILEAMERIGVDAIAVHLNALQEATQPEGETVFAGALDAMEAFTSESRWPVLAKETGAGISRETALALQERGVRWVDVGGYGGTSFAAVEWHRSKEGTGRELSGSLVGWGIPTAASLIEVASSTDMRVIASGGIRDGIDVAKCLALGAQCAGVASPILKALKEGGVDALLRLYAHQLKSVMFLTGSRDLGELRRSDLVLGSWLRQWARDRGIDPSRFASRS
jgi:isopentenyl-diphosphate delta-isomerase